MDNTYAAGQVVFVYYNLHKKLFSVRNKSGLVVGHTDNIILTNATFKVSEAGRQRVLREKRKNVHAGVLGTIALAPNKKIINSTFKTAFYDPYKYDSFVNADGERLHAADVVFLHKTDKAHVYYK